MITLKTRFFVWWIWNKVSGSLNGYSLKKKWMTDFKTIKINRFNGCPTKSERWTKTLLQLIKKKMTSKLEKDFKRLFSLRSKWEPHSQGYYLSSSVNKNVKVESVDGLRLLVFIQSPSGRVPNLKIEREIIAFWNSIDLCFLFQENAKLLDPKTKPKSNYLQFLLFIPHFNLLEATMIHSFNSTHL